jgi:hypothetical protein
MGLTLALTLVLCVKVCCYGDLDARLARYDAIFEQLQACVAQQMVTNARYDRLHEDYQAMWQAQLAHNQALYEMHAELRTAFVNLETRLARIEALLERGLTGSGNGRDA